MHFKVLLLGVLSSVTTFSIAGEGINSAVSELKTVTIYRHSAELTHTLSSFLKQGHNDLVIEGISNQLDINSIQINCPAGVTIMSVEFSNNFLRTHEMTPQLKNLHDSLESTQREVDKLQVSISTTSELIEVLKVNRDIKGSQTGLSVAELVKLMDYYKLKSIELQNELASQKERQKKLLASLSKIRSQIAEEEKKNTRVGGRLFLQLSVASAIKADFTVSYITQNAFWTPYYDIRVEDVKSPLKVIYKAKLVQTTGIDWKQVRLSLSTSVPNQWGNAPLLRSWFLSYINPVNVMERSLARNRIQTFDEAKALNEVVVTANGAAKALAPESAKEGRPLYVVNGAVMSEQEFSKINPASIMKREVQREIKESGAESAPTPVPNKTQENLQNRGLQEDQPKNPVRSTGSMASDQQEDTYRQPGDKFSEDADKISS